MDFTVTLTDPVKLAAITAARVDRNKSLPDEMHTVTVANPEYVEIDVDNPDYIDAEKTPDVPKTIKGYPDVVSTIKKDVPTGRKVGQIDSDAEYVQWVIESAAASWAVQHQVGEPTAVAIPPAAVAASEDAKRAAEAEHAP